MSQRGSLWRRDCGGDVIRTRQSRSSSVRQRLLSISWARRQSEITRWADAPHKKSSLRAGYQRELLRASKRMPGHVVGDGKQTVGELVEIVNQDPRRGIGHEKVLTRLEFDDQAERCWTRRATPDTVPAAGEIVYLRATANLSTGGTAIDVTDVVHPDNRADGDARHPRHRPRRRRHRLHHRRHHPVVQATSAAASARSTPRPASACTWRRARARRATSPGR